MGKRKPKLVVNNNHIPSDSEIMAISRAAAGAGELCGKVRCYSSGASDDHAL